MKLSIIIPVYNEIKTISQLVIKIENINISKEIIIVDDGSADGTEAYLEKLNSSKYKLLFHKCNLGKGAAIRTGLAVAEGDIIIIQDADLEYNPDDYHKIISSFRPGIDVVYGSRNLNPSNRKYSSLAFYWGGVFLSWLAGFLYGCKITDQTTCYKAFRKSVISKMNLKCNGFEFCSEVTANVRNLGYPIMEVPIDYNPRSFSEGKKIRWKDGLMAAFILIKYKVKFWLEKSVRKGGANCEVPKTFGFFSQRGIVTKQNNREALR